MIRSEGNVGNGVYRFTSDLIGTVISFDGFSTQPSLYYSWLPLMNRNADELVGCIGKLNRYNPSSLLSSSKVALCNRRNASSFVG